MRLTKIICTLGPTSSTFEQIRALAETGMNIARLNFSHGEHADQLAKIETLRKIQDDGYPVAIMMDTKGPEIRTGDVKVPIEIAKGQEVVFVTDTNISSPHPVIYVDNMLFAEDVKNARGILIDNGEMRFDLISIDKDGSVHAKAANAGRIGSRRHVNLPGADLQMASITDKDWHDLAFGVEQKLDFVALSFVRTGDVVREVKKFLRENNSAMRVIAKIETEKGVQNLDDIIEASDGIMVARGDLGAEIPFELLPAIQDAMVRKCREAGKPVIVATQMLESMIQFPMPTRAEVTDVAHAATTRADLTMLSAETANGKNPVAAVDAMARILAETESHLPAVLPTETDRVPDENVARAEAATVMALSMHLPAIIVLTRSGRTAECVSACRPVIPIIALTDSPVVQRQMQLLYGVLPLHMPFGTDPEETAALALRTVREKGLLKSGDHIVLLSDSKTADGPVSTVHLRSLP